MPLLYTHIYSINTITLIRCSDIEEYNLVETISISLPKVGRSVRELRCSIIRENLVLQDLQFRVPTLLVGSSNRPTR